MEQADSCKRHHHAVLVAGLDYIVVPNRTAWLGNVLHSAPMSTFNVVSKGEEGI